MAAVRVDDGPIGRITWGIKEWITVGSVMVSIGGGYASLKSELSNIVHLLEQRRPNVEAVPVIREQLNGHELRIGRLERKIDGG